MKYLILLFFTIFFIGSQADQGKCESCFCPSISKPVCGTSGKTHSNACFAKCMKDTVKSFGACPDVCVPNRRKYKRCTSVKYGKNGTRKRCCKFTKEGNVVIHRKCHWTSKPIFTRLLSKCLWKKVDSEHKQRHCCTQVLVQEGIKRQLSPKKCRYFGNKISTKFNNNCIWKPFGAHGRRKYCCQSKEVCEDKKCNTVRTGCAYTGEIHELKMATQCKWKILTLTSKQRKCCNVVTRCKFLPGQKKQCIHKEDSCKFVGKKLVSKNQRSCHWKKVGNDSRRQKCCTLKKTCTKGVCVIKKLRCQWAGCLVKRTTKTSCKWNRKSKGVRQRLCCESTKRCACNKCKIVKRRCKYVGKIISTKSKVGCHWKVTGKDAKTRQCCLEVKKCVGKFCTRKLTCHLVGLEIIRSIYTKCTWKVFEKEQKRKMCCEFDKSCVGGKCSTLKGACRFEGLIVTKSSEKGCKIRQLSPNHSRKWCCKGTKKCTGKKCVYVNRKCDWKGEIITKEPKKACFVRRFANALSQRNWCCNWVNFCYGKSCRPIEKKCTWEGPITQKFLKSDCKWENKLKLGTMQIKCCNFVRTCKSSELNKEENCKNTKKRCKFVGKIIKISQEKKCQMKAVGDNQTQKHCCTLQKVCQGKSCPAKPTSQCKFVGPIFKNTVHTKCFWKKNAANAHTRYCCKFNLNCVGSKCKKTNKKCGFYGRTVGTQTKCEWKKIGTDKRKKICCSVRKVCTHSRENGKKCVSKKSCSSSGAFERLLKGKCQWKMVKSTSGPMKKQYCCRKIRSCNKSAQGNNCKIVKQCSFSGKAIKLTQTFFKRQNKCKTVAGKRVCCSKVKKCSFVALEKPKCTTVKSQCKQVVVKTKPVLVKLGKPVVAVHGKGIVKSKQILGKPVVAVHGKGLIPNKKPVVHGKGIVKPKQILGKPVVAVHGKGIVKSKQILGKPVIAVHGKGLIPNKKPVVHGKGFVTKKSVTCVASQKGRITGFKKSFKHLFPGRWVLFKNKHLSVHHVIKKVSKVSHVVGFHAKIKGVVLKSTNSKTVTINNKVHKLPLNKIKAVGKIHILKVSKKKVHIFTKGKNGLKKLIAVKYNKIKGTQMHKLKIMIKAKVAGGLCHGEKYMKKGKKFYQKTVIVTKKVDRSLEDYCPTDSVKPATELCQKRGLTGKKLHTCIRMNCDTVQGGNGAEFIGLPTSSSTVISTKRNTCVVAADPFFRDFKENKEVFRTSGDFIMYKTKDLSIHIRLLKFKNGPLATQKVAVRINKDVIITTRGTFLINGKQVDSKVGVTMKLSTSTFKKISDLRTVIRIKDDIISITKVIVGKKTYYQVVVGLFKIDPTAKGVCVGMVKAAKKLFKKKISPKVALVKVWSVTERKTAYKACKKLSKGKSSSEVIKCMIKKYKAMTKPTKKPVNPLTKPLKPTKKPVKPLTKPVKPTKKPVKPLTKPLKPTKKPVKVNTKPLTKPLRKPTKKPVNPLTKPLNPKKPVRVEHKPLAKPFKPKNSGSK